MEFSFLKVAEVIFSSTSSLAVVVATLGSLIGAVLSLRRLKEAPSKAEGAISPVDVSAAERAAGRQTTPFEVKALSDYYNQALRRANLAFTFSIMFASIGFGVIIFAFVTHTASDIGGTIVKVTSGTIIDAVSGLFFVQSTSAQKSMGEFFEKLRLDRLNVEARELIGEIETVSMRDELRAQLVLKYSAIDKLLVGDRPPPA